MVCGVRNSSFRVESSLDNSSYGLLRMLYGLNLRYTPLHCASSKVLLAP